MKTNRKQIGAINRLASFKPGTVDEENRTIDITFSTGAMVKRFRFFGEDFYEELSMKPSAVRLDRLKGGAPFLNMHRAYDLDNAIGVIEKADVKNGVGTATVRFHDDRGEGPDGTDGPVEKIFRKVKNGILRNVSVGYRVHKFEELKDRADDGLKVMRAVDWEPHEVSLVTIPADAGARVRNEEQELYTCEFLTRDLEEEPMGQRIAPESSKKKVEPNHDNKVDLDKVRKEAAEAERKRADEIKLACRATSLDDTFADNLIGEGISVDRARAMIIDEMAKKDQEKRTVGANATITRDEGETRIEGFKNAILHRFDPVKNELSDVGREFRYYSLMDMAKVCLEAQGKNVRGMRPDDIAKGALTRGQNTTSDFPLLLENIATKTLRDAYAESPQTFAPITRRVQVPDFKQISRVQLGGAPALEKVLESGEIKSGTMSEQAEKYQVETYGKQLPISRQAIVNDDLDGFTRIPTMFGRRARDLESDLIWAVLTDNAALADGVTLFHADHGNVGTGGAVSLTTLGEARKLMRLQSDLNGELINVIPMWLIVPAAIETVAEQFLAQNLLADAAGNVNPFAGKLRLIVEPRLDANSVTAWYMAADVGQVDIIEMAMLRGEDGPRIESEMTFDVEGVKIKAVHDVGVKAIDYRGLVYNAGA